MSQPVFAPPGPMTFYYTSPKMDPSIIVNDATTNTSIINNPSNASWRDNKKKKKNTHVIDNKTDLSRFSLDAILYSDIELTNPIGHMVANKILYNSYSFGSSEKSLGVIDATYNIYTSSTNYGVIRIHHSEKSIINAHGMNAVYDLNASIIQATNNYSYFLPSNNVYKHLRIVGDANGITTVTFVDPPAYDPNWVDPNKDIIYTPFCYFNRMDSTYKNDQNIKTQQFHLIGRLFNQLDIDGNPTLQIGNLLSCMNVSNSNVQQISTDCYTTQKDFFVKVVYCIDNSATGGKKGNIVGIIASSNARFNKDGSVYNFYTSSNAVSQSSGSLICYADGDYSYLNHYNSENQPYKVIINSANGVRTLNVPIRVLNSDPNFPNTYTLHKNEIFGIAANTYWKNSTIVENYTDPTVISTLTAYITQQIGLIKFDTAGTQIYDINDSISKILRVTIYIGRQIAAQNYVKPKDITSNNPFYSAIFQEEEIQSNDSNFTFDNQKNTQNSVVNKKFKNCKLEIVCDRLASRHIYYTSLKAMTLTESCIYFDDDYWLNIMSGISDDITSTGDRPDGAYVSTVLSKNGFKSEFTLYFVIKNKRFVIIPNYDYDYETVADANTVIAGETFNEDEQAPLIPIPVPDSYKSSGPDDDYYYLYTKINKPSSLDISKDVDEYATNLDIFSTISENNVLSNKVGSLNINYLKVASNVATCDYLNMFNTFYISENSVVPHGIIQMTRTLKTITNINGGILTNGEYTAQIINSSNDFEYLVGFNENQYECRIIVDDNLRVYKFPKVSPSTTPTPTPSYQVKGYFNSSKVISSNFNTANSNQLIYHQIPIYSKKTISNKFTNIEDLFLKLSFLNLLEDNKCGTCSTYCVNLTPTDQIMFILADISQISKDGTILNESSTPLRIYFNICYATGQLKYLRPINKFVKGYLTINNNNITELSLPTQSSLNQITPAINPVPIIVYGGEVFNTKDYNSKNVFDKYTIYNYLYESLDHAKSGNITNSIGISSTSCRNYNSIDYQKEIKFTSYYFKRTTDSSFKTFFAPYSSSNKTKIDGSSTSYSYEESIMTYSGFGSVIPLNTKIEAIDETYSKISVYLSA